MSVRILGIGTALPTATLDQRAALAIAMQRCCDSERHARLLPALYRRSAVRTRHLSALQARHNGSSRVTTEFYPPRVDADDFGPSTQRRMADYALKAAPLAAEAANAAMCGAGIAAGQFTHVVSCSCTGFSAPGVDIHLIEQLGLPVTTQRTHIGFMGCHGAFNALQVGRAIAGAESEARVLVVAVELCSLHFAYGFEPQQIVANALFADGAGAAVLVGDEVTTGKAPVLRLRSTGSCLLPDSSDAMSWRIGDHGFVMTLSPRVPTIIQQHLRPWLTDWLGQHGLAIDDVDRWAIHPGGPRVLESVIDALELDRGAADVSRRVLEQHGNMSSATILFILRELAAEGAGSGPIVALGFGPGLVAEAMLFQ